MPVYLITYLLLFWLPVFGLGLYLWKKIDPLTKKAFWIAIGIMTIATFAMEYVYLWLDIWTFSEAIDPLVGLRLWGVPVEEFVFWWGASPLFVLMYFGYARLMSKKGRAH